MLAGNWVQTLVILPLNVPAVMPPELEAASPVVWQELERYLLENPLLEREDEHDGFDGQGEGHAPLNGESTSETPREATDSHESGESHDGGDGEEPEAEEAREARVGPVGDRREGEEEPAAHRDAG